MDDILNNNVQKIVIGKTWFYVALVILGALFIYMYRCHHEEPKHFREPDFLQ